jgi:PIN domain nuclease of toxin-antitoxin system
MRFLLDTNAVIWLIQDSPRLGKIARQRLADADNQVAVSYFSILEMKLKAVAGKLRFHHGIIDDLAAMQVDFILPDRASVEHFRIYDSRNKDPFDNLLITVALQERYALLTCDDALLKLAIPGVKVIDSRT